MVMRARMCAWKLVGKPCREVVCSEVIKPACVVWCAQWGRLLGSLQNQRCWLAMELMPAHPPLSSAGITCLCDDNMSLQLRRPSASLRSQRCWPWSSHQRTPSWYWPQMGFGSSCPARKWLT
eukprot:scaffold52394_cov17-Tisochrysis_lutea.AAC.1